MTTQDPTTRAGAKAFCVIGKPFKGISYMWRAAGTRKYGAYESMTQLMTGDQIHVRLDTNLLPLKGGRCLNLLAPFDDGTLIDAMDVYISMGKSELYVQIVAEGNANDTKLTVIASTLPLGQVKA